MSFREFGASGSPRLGKTPIRKGKPRRRGEHRGFGLPFCGGKPVAGREAHHDNIVTPGRVVSATLTDNCSVSSCRPSPATVGHLCSHQISREDVDGGKFGGKPGNGCRAFLFSQGPNGGVIAKPSTFPHSVIFFTSCMRSASSSALVLASLAVHRLPGIKRPLTSVSSHTLVDFGHVLAQR